MTGQNIIGGMTSLSPGRNASRVSLSSLSARRYQYLFLPDEKEWISFTSLSLSLSLSLFINTRFEFRELRVHHVLARNAFASTRGASREINAIVRHRPVVLFVGSRRCVGSMSVWNIRAIRFRDIRLIIHARSTPQREREREREREEDRATRVVVGLRFIHAPKQIGPRNNADSERVSSRLKE